MENKINLLDLGAIESSRIETFTINNIDIGVKTRIPCEELLDMVQWTVSYVMGDRPFISAILEKIVSDLAIIKFYTNIECIEISVDNIDTAKLYEWYDILLYHNVLGHVIQHIDANQLSQFHTLTHQTLESIVNYKNSAAGLVDKLADNAAKNAETMEEAMGVLNDPKNVSQITDFIKTIHSEE